MHLFRTCITQQLYNTVGSCSADDRIIDHDDTFAINNLSDRIQLDLYTAFPVFLLWLDKGSSDIGILYKSSIIGIPDCMAYPIAAQLPDSGTPVTMSASTGLSIARYLPAIMRE